jgi:hypothetical protein
LKIIYVNYIATMRLKSELYKKEQDDITDKIISILDLENKNRYTLYELDITNIKVLVFDVLFFAFFLLYVIVFSFRTLQ